MQHAQLTNPPNDIAHPPPTTNTPIQELMCKLMKIADVPSRVAVGWSALLEHLLASSHR